MLHSLKSIAFRIANVRLPGEPLPLFGRRLWSLFRRWRASRGSAVASQDVRAVARLLTSRKIAYGPQVRSFEREFAAMYGASGAAASSSGTAAVHTALAMVGVGPGDHVIVPPITDMGTILPILARNALPIFVDVDPETWNLSPEAVETAWTPRTRAIAAVHLFGNPCDLDRLGEIAKRRGAFLIEDCAQAHWAQYAGQPVGTIGDVGAFSLQWTKQMTSCEGGMTITRHAELAQRGRLFVDKGWNREARTGARQYPLFGLNYRMSEMQAAMGRSQLRRLQETVKGRSDNARRAIEVLEGTPGIRFQKVQKNCVHSYWQLAFSVDQDAPFTADAVVDVLRRHRISCSAHYIGRPIHLCHEPLLERRLYERSDLPFSLDPDGPPDYGRVATPVAQSVLDRLVVIPTPSDRLAGAEVRNLAIEIKGAIERLADPSRMQVKPRARYRLGVVGCGLIAKEHLDAAARIPALHLEAIADVDARSLLGIGSSFGVASRYTDFEEMFAKKKLDAVLVSVWPKLHAPVTVAAAQSGVRAILCEKPMASDLGGAKAMLDAVGKSGSILVIGHQHRFNPHLGLARDLLQNGAVGAIERVSARCPSSLINNGSHVIDAIFFMLGDPEVDWVEAKIERARGLSNRGQAVEERCRGSIHFREGIVADIEMGEDIAQPVRWTFAGQDGSLEVELDRVSFLPKGKRSRVLRRVRVRSMEDQLAALVDCLDNPARTHPGAAERGYAAMEVLIGLLESARVGERVAMPVQQMAYPLEVPPDAPSFR